MSPLLPAGLASVALSYLLCGIPFGLLIARHSPGHVDVRHVGSGNIGMTNVARSAGALAGAATLLCDAGKGFLAVSLSRLLLTGLAPVASADLADPRSSMGWLLACVCVACVLGHVFSPYLHLRGGKGISVGFGSALALWWPLALGVLLVFLVFAVPSRYVSLGSIAAALALPLLAAAFGFHVPAVLLLALASGVVLWRHRENAGRLLAGTERRFTVHPGNPKEKSRGTKRRN